MQQVERVRGGLTSRRLARARFTALAAGKTSLQWRNPTLSREGARLQFVAFDALYLERLQRGDPRTERHFASYFGELIRIKLRSRLDSPDAIEDVRQETFARVLSLVRTDDGIRQPERLGALVNSVCNLVLLEHYRSNRRFEARIDDEPEHALIAEEDADTGSYDAQEAERVVRKILEDMTERDRRLLQSVLLEERDKDEVCSELGLSREYLRVLVHRAKLSFKASFTKRFGKSG